MLDRTKDRSDPVANCAAVAHAVPRQALRKLLHDVLRLQGSSYELQVLSVSSDLRRRFSRHSAFRRPLDTKADDSSSPGSAQTIRIGHR